MSTMICDSFASPFWPVGTTDTRNSGASISVPVIGRTVRDPSSPNGPIARPRPAEACPGRPGARRSPSRLASRRPACRVRCVVPGALVGVARLSFTVAHKLGLPSTLLSKASSMRIWNPDLDRPQSGRPELIAPSLNPLCARSCCDLHALHVATSAGPVHRVCDVRHGPEGPSLRKRTLRTCLIIQW